MVTLLFGWKFINLEIRVLKINRQNQKSAEIIQPEIWIIRASCTVDQNF